MSSVPGSGEDFLDDDGDGDDEFIDTTAEEVPPKGTSSSTSSSGSAASPSRGRRLIRIKPLSPALASKFPGVTTILVTRNDGSQILFVQQKSM